MSHAACQLGNGGKGGRSKTEGSPTGALATIPHGARRHAPPPFGELQARNNSHSAAGAERGGGMR